MTDFSPGDMTPFKDLIISNEKYLTKRLFHYAFKHNYAEGSAAVEEAWSNCVAGLSGAILQSIDIIYPDYEFGPDHDFRNDPLCEFIVDTARRHRERGVSLQMFHGLMVYYKEAWLDLVKNSEFAVEYKNLCLNIVARMFDRFMIALCAEWAEHDQSKLIEELQIRNREAIVEKNKFLTIFESTPNPLLIIDDLKLIVNFNYAAAVMMNVSNLHGSQYYYPHIGKMEFVAHNAKENSSGVFHAVKGQPVTAFFPWLAGDLDDFITGSAASVDFEKEVPDQEATKCFNVKLSRWSDVSKTFTGGVVILEDITRKKRAEQELQLVKEKQREWILLNENRLNRVLKILQHGSYSVSEFLDYALDEAITLTGSRIGYILYYDENTQEFIINTWSRGAMQECSIDYKPTVFHLKDTGIWGEAVRQRKPLIINDYMAANPLKRGYPEGHVHIGRFIEIPVFNDNNIVAVVAVANKESDYDQTDMLQLSLFMNSVWKSVNMKKMEEALFKSEEQYRTVFETTGSATVIIDENGTVTLANGEFCKLSGYSKKEIEHNKKFNEFIEPNDLDKLAEYFLLRQMEPDTVRDNSEFRAVNRQGKVIDLIISVSMIPGTRNKVVSMVNITDRKQTESALRRSEDKFSKVFYGSPDPITITTLGDGRYVEVNDAWLKYSGYEKQELIGNTTAKLGIWDIPEERSLLLSKIQKEGSVCSLETRIQIKSGEHRRILLSSDVIDIEEQPHLLCVLKDIEEHKRMKEELHHNEKKIAKLRKIAAKTIGIGNIYCFSDSIHKIVSDAGIYHNDRSMPVLIQGETGTGKELVAKLIHYGDLDDTVDSPFIDINCAAINHGLFESELFGYEAGAFTGGLIKGQNGKFDLAQGGTLFLDEIAEIPIELQGKLLRVIQEKEYYRVGGLKKMKTDVRIICATNADLAASVQKGTFRKDLFYRLSVGCINIPPLRARPESILPLASFFLKQASEHRNKNFTKISLQAGQILKAYHWPGNVRELKNLIDSIVFMHDDTEIKPLHLDKIVKHNVLYSDVQFGDNRADEVQMQLLPELLSQVDSFSVNMTDDEFSLDRLVDEIIDRALVINKGNKTKTSRYLGISRTSLYNRLKNRQRK